MAAALRELGAERSIPVPAVTARRYRPVRLRRRRCRWLAAIDRISHLGIARPEAVRYAAPADRVSWRVIDLHTYR